jgi:hypothetical protein
MRHSLLFPAVILLLGAASVAAHAQEREIGGKLGASVATMGRDVTQSSDDPFRARTGITAGAYLFQPLADRFGVQFELLFTEKGGSVAFHEPSIVQGTMSTRYKFQYMDIPVLARVRGPRIRGMDVNVFGGPTMSLRTSAKRQRVFDLETPVGFEGDLGGETKRFDFGFTFGGLAQVNRRLSFDVRYTHGLTGVVDDDNGVALSNRGLLITAGIRVF